MSYYGDIRLGDTIDIKFTTRQLTGVPTNLSGGTVVAYPANSTTEITAGITLSGSPFDSVAGLNNIRIVATSGNGYATATNYFLVLSAGTVNSVSVIGEVVGSFSIENRSALMPTTAARTVDISATGEAGLDFDNIKDATGAHTLTNITVPIVTTTGTATAVTTVNGLAADVITAAATAADFGAEVAAAVWRDAVAGDFTVANSVGKSVMNGVALGTGLTVNAVTGLTASDVGTIKTKTDFLPSATAGAAGGVFIAGTNAATTITTGLTTHFIGTLDTVTTYTGNTPQTGDNYALANGLNGFVAIKGDTAAIKLKTDNLPSDPADASDIASAFSTVNTTLATLPSAATIAAAVWAYTVEGTYTAVQYLRGFAATLFWKSAGQATANPTFRDAADLKNRIDGTADADGNRSAVTVDLS